MSNEVHGYKLILASEVGDRDGMGLELTAPNGERVAEVFADDDTGERSFRQFVDGSIPLAAIEWLLDSARTRL